MKFVGARLKLARAYRDITLKDLAETVGSSTSVLGRFEANEREPEMLMVRALSEALGFQEVFFYRPLADQFTLKECSFRKKATTRAKVKNRILAQGTLLSELVSEIKVHIMFPKTNVLRVPHAWSLEAAEEAASLCRAHWSFGDGPIGNMVRVLENAGVMVARLHDDDDSVDAFSRTGEVPFVILNDAKGSSSRARMDMAHELGHLVMHDGATDDEQEQQAHRFAGAFLLPEGSFGRHYRSLGVSPSWGQLFDLKQRWGVSVALIIRRAFDLRLMSAIEYQQRNKHLSYMGWRKGEPYEPAPEQPELLRSAVQTLVTRTDTSRRALLGRLGWSERTFEALTGVSLTDDVGDVDLGVIPIARARLSLS